MQANPEQSSDPQRSPTPAEPTAVMSLTDSPNQISSVEPVFEVRLSTLRSGARVLRAGTEIPLEQAQAAILKVDDGIELVSPDGQAEQSYSILDFSNVLEIELFSNTSVFINGFRQTPEGSSEVVLDLDRGHLFVHSNEETDSQVTVQTLFASVKTLTLGAEFDICQNDERTCVLVKKGVVEITAEGKKNILKAGEAGFVLRNETPSPPICAPIPTFIAWADQFRLFASTPSLDTELSQLKQSPCPVASSGLPFDARLLYRDEFRHPSSGWTQGKLDSFTARYARFEGRRYYEVQVQGAEDTYQSFVPNEQQYEDVNIDVRIIAEAASGDDFRYGTIFRRSGNQYYAFVISPISQTWHFLKSSSTGLETLREGVDTRMRGLESRNVLRVESYGSVFLLFINGRFIDWIRDSEYATGEVGLFVESMDSSKAIIQFDSIIIWDMPPLLQNPNQGGENCFNTIDDDSDGLIDRADPTCQRLDSSITALPPRTVTPATTRTPAPVNTARPPTDSPVNTPVPTIQPPLPTIVPPLPTIIAPLPTLIAPLPTILAPLPTLLPPLPTIQLPFPLRDNPSTPTPG